VVGAGRRFGLLVITAVVTLTAFFAVSWPRPIAPAGVSVDAGRAANFLDSVPLLPVESPTTTVAPPPEPPTTVAVAPRGRGRTLGVGFAPPAQTPATIARAIVSEVGLYSAPGQAEPDDWQDNPTWEGLPGVFLVHGRQGDWLNVQVSMRPNQATAWIKASEVTISQTSMHILVDTSARTLTLYDGSAVAWQTSVAPGTADSPTPTGDFFVDGIVKLSYDDGPYGAYQVSVAAFSNVYYSFGSGNGQIAIHGTNDPALIGTPASHGCVRMTNEDISALASMVPLGTPVRIV
jgi:lipoprotein-anchoring transpeptidase ErfK/SrfK